MESDMQIKKPDVKLFPSLFLKPDLSWKKLKTD